AQRAESSQFRDAQWRSLLALLWAVSEFRRLDRDVARRGAQHLQSQDRFAGAGYVLGVARGQIFVDARDSAVRQSPVVRNSLEPAVVHHATDKLVYVRVERGRFRFAA